MHTYKNGRATFTVQVQVGAQSDIGTYDTEIEVTKDNHQSISEQDNSAVMFLGKSERASYNTGCIRFVFDWFGLDIQYPLLLL